MQQEAQFKLSPKPKPNNSPKLLFFLLLLCSVLHTQLSLSSAPSFSAQSLVMAEVAQRTKFDNGGKRKKFGRKKGPNKKQKFVDHNKAKQDKNLQRLFAKRAKEYNSDDEEEDEEKEQEVGELENLEGNENESDVELSNEEQENKDKSVVVGKEKEGSDDDAEEEEEEEEEDVLPGDKFKEGIRAFRVAFKKIVKKTGDEDDLLGPVLIAQKALLAEKLAEEVLEKKVNKEAKKEKILVKERGHVKDVKNSDVAHEKLLLSVATKGVVKLFNAVNKAQNAQRGLNPSRSKDEKVIKKRRKEAFFSELGKKSSESSGKFVKGSTSGGNVDDEGPAWAPLRDNYMLTNPKLKDWDKMPDTNDEDDFGRQSDNDSSSGDDD